MTTRQAGHDQARDFRVHSHSPTASLHPPGTTLLFRLQRTAGNRAVTDLVRSAKAGASGSPVHPVVQRLIGFEVETRIPVRFMKADGVRPARLKKADYNTINADVGTGDGSKLVVDKEGENSILELTTGAVDDRQSETNFRQTALAWTNVLTGLRTDALGSPPLLNLHAKYGGAPANSRFGFETALARGADIDKLAFQVTHGLRLDQAAAYLKKREYKNKIGGRDQKKEDALQQTHVPVDAVMAAIKAHVSISTAIPGWFKNTSKTKALKELEGFLTLVGHYLVLGGKDIQAYLKNQLSLFYKSELSDVRADLIAANPYALTVLNLVNRPFVKAQLLAHTNRGAGDPLFRHSATTCGPWLDAVLGGHGDPFFQEAKNNWGVPIAPGTVKGKLAAVVEHRDLTKEIIVPATTNLSNPAGVVDYLVKTFKANKKAQDL
jgi:hypothetical protein